MKYLFVIANAGLTIAIAGLTVFSAATPAGEVSHKCYTKAERAVQDFVDEAKYDVDGFAAYTCEVATNQKVVICEVSAAKGDGAASDTYRVVLNRSCTYKYRVELIGEE